MEYDNDRKISHPYKMELFFWVMLVVLNPLVTTITYFWFLPAFSIALLFISVALFPGFILYARFVVPNFFFQKRYFAFAFASLVFFFLIQLFSISIHKFILLFSLRMPEQFYLSYSARTVMRDGLWALINMVLCLGFSFLKKSFD